MSLPCLAKEKGESVQCEIGWPTWDWWQYRLLIHFVLQRPVVIVASVHFCSRNLKIILLNCFILHIMGTLKSKDKWLVQGHSNKLLCHFPFWTGTVNVLLGKKVIYIQKVGKKIWNRLVPCNQLQDGIITRLYLSCPCYPLSSHYVLSYYRRKPQFCLWIARVFPTWSFFSLHKQLYRTSIYFGVVSLNESLWNYFLGLH